MSKFQENCQKERQTDKRTKGQTLIHRTLLAMARGQLWVDNGSDFYNRSMKSWLQYNDIEMYSTHNEGESVVAERFIRTLKKKIYKYMTSIS